MFFGKNPTYLFKEWKTSQREYNNKSLGGEYLEASVKVKI